MNIFLEDIRYHVEISGQGFPLLLLHGFTGDSSTWSPFREAWGRHSKLIIPDIIGHGKTDTPVNVHCYKIETAAHHLKQILDQLKVEQVDILGYSMGGRLGLTFALLFPDRVRKLIIESGSPGLQTEEERQLRRMKDGELAQFIKEKGIIAFVDYWESIPLFSTMNDLPEAVRKSIRRQRLANSPIGLENSLIGMGTGSQPSWWEELEKLSCEVLLLTGAKDEKFCQIAKNMEKKIKNVVSLVFNESGHTIHVEDAGKFGTIVSDFLIKT